MGGRKKRGCLRYVLMFICIFIIIDIALNVIIELFNGDDEPEPEKAGVTGIEVQKAESGIDDFLYELSGDAVILGSYDGSDDVLEITPSYDINGKEYRTDLSEFQVGGGVNTLILDEGITEVNTSIFNLSDIERVFFPMSMTNVYDYTLAYLHPDDGETIKIYYAGTQDDWMNIFTKYKRKKVEDTKLGEEMGQAVADKINEMVGTEYDSSEFEYYFSAKPEDLRR